MSTDIVPLSLLQVSGKRVVDASGNPVQLRGVCLGGWLNQENFITGYPANESAMKAALQSVLGPEKTRFFFERFLEHFVTEADIRFVKTLGMNVIRVPFNYRLFESDDAPFQFIQENFRWLDRVIGWGKQHGVYIILDLHAAPGWQNRGWHSDNPTREAMFWGNRQNEERAVALWKELTCRYWDEPAVAGYNLLNEPDTEEVPLLNRYYRRASAVIRDIDPSHILFLEGNRYSKRFEGFDEPFDGNIVYSTHDYVEPSLNECEYPGVVNSQHYDRDRLAQEYAQETAWIRERGLPNWVGEFGGIFTGGPQDVYRIAAVRDMVSIFEEHQHHWTMWTYKDLGFMGLVRVNPESEWMRRTQPVREAKTRLRTDNWVERTPGLADAPVRALAEQIVQELGDRMPDANKIFDMLIGSLGPVTFSKALLPAFADQFKDMTETQIDEMMQSFRLENCLVREEYAEALQVKG